LSPGFGGAVGRSYCAIWADVIATRVGHLASELANECLDVLLQGYERVAAGWIMVPYVEDLERPVALRDLDCEAVLEREAVEAAGRDDPDAVRLRDASELGSHARGLAEHG
jgi:hypothetical protein